MNKDAQNRHKQKAGPKQGRPTHPYRLILPDMAEAASGQTADMDAQKLTARYKVPAWILSSPHSGSYYPPDFIADSALNAHDLRKSEDAYIDALLADMPKHNAALLLATYPRAYIDLNRAPYELDADMFADPLPDYVDTASYRARRGLGTIARLVAADMPIYRRKLHFAEAHARLQKIYFPFHKALRHVLDKAIEQHGRVRLLDIHSMPSRETGKKHMPDIIIGDRHATSCPPALTKTISDFLRANGYRTICNNPYSGGYITKNYGKPPVEAVQIEILRTLYMDEDSYQLHAGFMRLKSVLENLVQHLQAWQAAQAAPADSPAAEAAE